MIPILFEANETQFNTFGIGFLGDAIKCVVTEERNGVYELLMEYPIDGILFEELKENRIIFAKPSDNKNPQAFRIYKITEPMDIVTVSAEHISYQLNYIPVAPITATSCAEAFRALKDNSLISNPFNFYTDKSIEKVYTTGEPRSARNILGGTEGSILQEFQGEYEFDNWDVHLWKRRGSDTGVTLRYGKNITDFEQEKDLTNTVTGVLPYWKNETHLVIGDITEVSPGKEPSKIETIDITSELTSDAEGYIPTKAEVTRAGAAALENKSYVGVPSVNLRISFVALWQTDEYKDIAPLEKVSLCDTVKVFYEPLGVETSAKVIRTEYDVLLERYNEIEIGDKITTLSEKIVSQSKEITNVKTRIEKTFDTITLEVENGYNSSVIKLTGDGIQTQAKTLQFTGDIIFASRLVDGITTISGSNIKTGSIDANLITTGRFYARNPSGDNYVSIDTETGLIRWDMSNSTLDKNGNFISKGNWTTGIIHGDIYSSYGNSVDDENYDACIEFHNQFSNISGYVTRIYNDHIILDGDLNVPNPDYTGGSGQSEYFIAVENGSYVGSDSYENPISYTTISDVTRDLSFETKNNVVSDIRATRDYNDFVRGLSFQTQSRTVSNLRATRDYDDFVRNLSFLSENMVSSVTADKAYSDYVRNLSLSKTENVISDLAATRAYADAVKNLKFTTTTINGQTVLTGAAWDTFNPITSLSWNNNSVISGASWSNSSAVTGLTVESQSVLSSAAWENTAPITGLYWDTSSTLKSATWGNSDPITGLDWTNNTVLQRAEWENRTFAYASSNTYRRVINGVCV